MAFEPNVHLLKIVIINCGKLLWPDEKNITNLYERASEALNVPKFLTTTKDGDHLPTPMESALGPGIEGNVDDIKIKGYVIPINDVRKRGVQVNGDIVNKLTSECPSCHKRSLVLHGLCRSCKDAEDGKYKTMLRCGECGYSQRSEDPIVTWLDKLGIEFGTQTKESLGIKTVTDEGIK